MEQDWLSFGEVFQTLSAMLQKYLPYLLAAFLLILIGLLASYLLRLWAFHLVKRIGRSRLMGRETEESSLSELTPRTVASIVFWGSLLLFAGVAAQALGISVMKGGLSQLAVFLPNLFAAIIVLVAGILLGNLTKASVYRVAYSAGLSYATVLGQSGRVLVLVVTGMIVVAQIGIDSTVLVLVFGLILGGTVGGMALAFGFGARTSVSNLIAVRSVERNYRLGDLIKVGDIEGRILEISSGTVILETESGRTVVPAKLFDESVTQLIEEED